MRTFSAIVAASLTIVSLAAAVQDQMDMELRMKWAMAELVHYDVVAEYSAPTRVIAGFKTGVKDRFEVSFDYVPLKSSVTGKPVFKNAVSTVTNVFEGAPCMQVEALGPYEHLDIMDAKPTLGALELTIKRTFPAGRLPKINEVTGQCEFSGTEAKVETLTHAITVILGTVFGAPALAPKHVRIGESASEDNTVTVGKDQKTIVVDSATGWKYTYTLRIVK